LVKQFDRARDGGKPVVAWREPIHYAGLDVQFFSALIFPKRDSPEQFFDSVEPQLFFKHDKVERSDFSIRLNSKKQTISLNSDQNHSFEIFFGPKRTQLLKPLQADEVVRLGWFSMIAKAMLGTLGFFHSFVGLPYAFAIILLTLLVRSMMFPI